MSTPALYNIKTVTGLQDCLVLQVIDSLGNVISGNNYVVRGAIALKGETYNLTVTQDALGDYLLTWENLPAGVWRYDIFVNEEPLLYGNAIVQGRVTPCVTENTQDLGQFLQVQKDQEGVVKITLSDVNSAKWYAEVAKGSADEAKNVLQETENLSLDIERQIESGKTEISEATTTSVSSINSAGGVAVEDINSAKEDAIEEVSLESEKIKQYTYSKTEADERYGQLANENNWKQTQILGNRLVFSKTSGGQKYDNYIWLDSDGAFRFILNKGTSTTNGFVLNSRIIATNGISVQNNSLFSETVFFAGDVSFSGTAEFYGDVTTVTGIHALPLGTKTTLGDDAYGLSVSADGGLQLWGTHFMQGSIWGDNGLKMVENEVSLTSTDFAAIGFDYANNVVFRTMPNDGDGHGVFKFECWKWEDDSHTSKVLGFCDVQKNSARQLNDTSLLNLRELQDNFLSKTYTADQTVISSVLFHGDIECSNFICKNLTANGTTYLQKIEFLWGGSPTYSIRPKNTGGAYPLLMLGYDIASDDRGAIVQVPSLKTNDIEFLESYGSSFTISNSDPDYVVFNSGKTFSFTNRIEALGASFSGVVGFVGDNNMVQLTAGMLSAGLPGLYVTQGIKTDCIVECCHLETSGGIWVHSSARSGANMVEFRYDNIESQFTMSKKLSVPDLVIGGKTIDEIIEEEVTAILTEKGII